MKVGMTTEAVHRQSEVITNMRGSFAGSNADSQVIAVEAGQSPAKTPDINSDEAKAAYGYGNEVINVWSWKYVGIYASYFSVGIIYAGSVTVLYPVLIVKNNIDPNKYNAAQQLVTLFWSYKIFFGLISDCFPIMGLRRKPYMLLGWTICAVMLILLAVQNPDNISSNGLVIYLMLSNFGYVFADVCADGFLVFIANHEPIEIRGQTQSMCYLVREIGRCAANLLIGFALSGPAIMCNGYLSNKNTPCPYPNGTYANYTFFDSSTQDSANYCHEACSSATFKFGLTIPQYAWILAACNIAFIPLYVLLNEHKSAREAFFTKIGDFWNIFQYRAVWQITLWTINSAILANVSNNAAANSLNYWLSFSPIQNSVLNIMDNLTFIAGLSIIRRYFINASWRKMMIFGTMLPVPLGLLYLLIVYNVWRNSYFYMFTALSSNFLSTLTFLVSVFVIVEVSQPGYEAITYSLVTSANNMVSPLSTVLSNQISGLFALQTPDLVSDTTYVHNQFTYCWLLCTAINIASLLTLPLLPKQKADAKELLATGGRSKLWAGIIMVFLFVALVYSSIANFATMDPTFSCHYWLGGSGCSASESQVPAILLIVAAFLWVIITTVLIGYRKVSFPNY